MKDYKQMTEEILAARDEHVKNRSRRIRIIGSVTAAVLVLAAVVFVVITSNENLKETHTDVEYNQPTGSGKSEENIYNPGDYKNDTIVNEDKGEKKNNTVDTEDKNEKKNDTAYIENKGEKKEEQNEIAPVYGDLETVAFAAENPFVDYKNTTMQKKTLYSDGVKERLAAFTADTAKEYYSITEGNFVYSPISLYLGLAVNSELELEDYNSKLYEFLGVKDRAELEENVKKILEAISSDMEGDYPFLRNICLVANSVWLDDEMTEVEEESLKDISEKTCTDIYRTDLQSQDTVGLMNSWINKRTNGLIKSIPERPNGDTFSVVFNTIYMSSAWDAHLEIGKTEQGDFNLASGEKKNCEFFEIKMNEDCRYRESLTSVSAVLPLMSGSQVIFIEPKENSNPEQVINEELQDIITSFSEDAYDTVQTMDVRLPKFSYETMIENMEKILFDKLGLGTSMIPNSILDIQNAEKEPSIGRIYQNCKIGMDEKGIEAAAVTEVLMDSVPRKDSGNLVLNLDKPFAYVIMSGNNTPLFVGVVENPEK